MKKYLLMVLGLILSMVLVACDAEGSTGTEGGSSEKPKQEDEKKDEKKVYSIGDTVEFKDAKFTLKAVTTTDERNEFADIDPTAVIKIEYELENLSDDDLSYGMDITVYDADGNQMETYPNDSSMGAIASGKKVQGHEHHAVETLGKIEIHYAPIVSLEKAAVFEVEVE